MLSIDKNVKKSLQRNSFLSCSKDMQTIIRRLFVESKPYSDDLKKLLVLNQEDCLTSNNPQYRKVIEDYSVKKLLDEGYVRIIPKLPLDEHNQKQSYIIIEFDDFVPTKNPEFRDCYITFTVICNLDAWKMDDYTLRPHTICGYIDGILNDSKLSGIGRLQFIGASEVVLDERLAGVLLRYQATHSSDDYIKGTNAGDQ